MSDSNEPKPKILRFWKEVADIGGIEMNVLKTRRNRRKRHNGKKYELNETRENETEQKESTQIALVPAKEPKKRSRSLFSLRSSGIGFKRSKQSRKSKARRSGTKLSLQLGASFKSHASSTKLTEIDLKPSKARRGNKTHRKAAYKGPLVAFESNETALEILEPPKETFKTEQQRISHNILKQFIKNAAAPKLPSRHTMNLMKVELVTLKKEDPNSFFSNLELISRNKYSKLFKCYDVRNGRKQVAVKMIRVRESFPLEQIFTEISSQTLAPHDNIVRYLETFLYDKRIFMVMDILEYCLKTLIQTTYYVHMRAASIRESMKRLKIASSVHSNEPPYRWSEDQIAYVCRETLKGLDFLHKNHRLHRDIKSDNILISSTGQVKISDFSLATIQNKEKVQRSTPAGTIYWVAPEIIYDMPYSSPADIWSFGVLILEMTQGMPPLYDLNGEDVVYLLRNREFSPALKNEDGVSDELLRFAYACLNMEPKHRPRAEEALMHVFPSLAATQEAFGAFVVEYLQETEETPVNIEQPNNLLQKLKDPEVSPVRKS